jgi:single-strand DNA-binding protein
MSTLNEVKLIGHLGTNPEAIMSNGKSIGTKIVVYVNDDYVGKDGKKIERSYQHQVSLFGKLADFAMNYSARGNQVYVNAKLTTANYLNKDNVRTYVTQVVASEYGHAFQNLTPKGHTSANAQNKVPETEFHYDASGDTQPKF